MSQSALESTIHDIAANPKYVHFLMGKTQSIMYELYPLVGSLGHHPGVIAGSYGGFKSSNKDEKLKVSDDLPYFFREYLKDEHQFMGHVFGNKFGDFSYVFQLLYLDRTHDRRLGTFVRYALLIPQEDGAVINAITEHPGILIDLFRSVFPGHDNSGGLLKIAESEFSDI